MNHKQEILMMEGFTGGLVPFQAWKKKTNQKTKKPQGREWHSSKAL